MDKPQRALCWAYLHQQSQLIRPCLLSCCSWLVFHYGNATYLGRRATYP